MAVLPASINNYPLYNYNNHTLLCCKFALGELYGVSFRVDFLTASADHWQDHRQSTTLTLLQSCQLAIMRRARSSLLRSLNHINDECNDLTAFLGGLYYDLTTLYEPQAR